MDQIIIGIAYKHNKYEELKQIHFTLVNGIWFEKNVWN